MLFRSQVDLGALPLVLVNAANGLRVQVCDLQRQIDALQSLQAGEAATPAAGPAATPAAGPAFRGRRLFAVHDAPPAAAPPRPPAAPTPPAPRRARIAARPADLWSLTSRSESRPWRPRWLRPTKGGRTAERAGSSTADLH